MWELIKRLCFPSEEDKEVIEALKNNPDPTMRVGPRGGLYKSSKRTLKDRELAERFKVDKWTEREKFYGMSEEDILKARCRDKIIRMLEEVLDDTMQVFDFGAEKHPDSGDTPNFLTPNGNKCSLEVRGNSCLHHSADVRAGETKDWESGLHPALHLISSAAILYIRQKRGITNEDIRST